MNLFADSKPFNTHHLKVDEIHTLYIEESGTRGAIPVLFLHGGPGGGCDAFHRRYFDPDRYHVILFDQRGCGKSTPHASLENNTTWHLVDDIETIRKTLDIDQFVIFGGSWGSTLALAYAEKYPKRVLRLILRGIFLCRQKDINWFYQHGTSRLFPEAWENYLKPIPVEERGDLIKAYHKRLTSSDETTQLEAAQAWSVWEASTATLKTSLSLQNSFANPYFALSFARIECHYFIHLCFFRDNQLLEEISKIQDIKGYIVHGRYDAICPVDQAIDLHNVWHNSELNIIADAGHSLTEPGITQRLLDITQEVADELS